MKPAVVCVIIWTLHAVQGLGGASDSGNPTQGAGIKVVRVNASEGGGAVVNEGISGLSSSSSSESASTELHNAKLVVVEDTNGTRKLPVLKPIITNFEPHTLKEYLNLPPSKVLMVTKVLTNITLNACPKVGRSLLDSLNVFIASTLARSRATENLTTEEESVFRDNYRKLKDCENFSKSFGKQVSPMKSSIDYYYDTIPTVNPSSSPVKRRKRSNRGVEITPVAMDEADLVEHGMREIHGYMLTNYLQKLVINMKRICIHQERPSNPFTTYFVENIATRVDNNSEKKFILASLKKYLKRGKYAIKELQMCHDSVVQGTWTTQHDDSNDYDYD